ncbi:ATP-dependent RNA helicase Ddx1-like isoform X3 [Procambarus clarkii]|uniref:ATP-dependent RNA helicase Ddx1-like isoform X3 n=1 Tax=Procambarus clarkii TaxID=6728 RepID=UPI0037435827
MAALDLGTCKSGFGFGGTGKKSNCKQFDDYGESFGLRDVIGCYLNLDAMEMHYSKNGTDLGKAFALRSEFKNAVFHPAVVLKNAEMSFNFGATEFKHPPKAGYVAVSQASKDCTVSSGVKGGGDKPQKLQNNAPHAVIIEGRNSGIPVKEQIAALNAGVDIVCGTPGRLEDLINTGQLSLQSCKFFVLDEADGLLKQGHERLINNIYNSIPKITSEGKRLQMVVCSATLHSFEVKRMAERLMHFPTWVDLKGEDAVPETVHHVVVTIDPRTDSSWSNLRRHLQTDGVHVKDGVQPGNNTPETLSEAVKLLKGEYCIKAIDTHKMDQALIFCRTKLDCDNLERYFNQIDSKVVWTPNLVRQVKRAFRIVRRDEDGRNCVRRGKRPPFLLTLCSTIDLCTPNTSNCRRTGWRGRQTPIAPTLSAHNLLNFPAPSQLNFRLWDRCS